MATPVEAPKLGNSVEEVLVTRWIKHRGDAVSEGDIVAEIETDKATFEVTAPVGGVVLETFFDEGALVPVYTNLFVIGRAGESVDGFRPQAAAASTSAAVSDVAAHEAAAPEIRPGVGTVAGSASFSPRARRFADEHNFHPGAVNGSGPGGRVLEEDLRRLFYLGAATGVTTAAISTKPVQPAPTRAAGGTIRDKIARRMRESLATTAQYTLNASANAGGLLKVRGRIKGTSGPDININDLVAFCTIKALLLMPELNAEYIDGKIRQHKEVHLGFACDTPRGLMVPVIRNAHGLAIGELAARAKDLTARAVQGSVSPDDLSGATFTVSNLGGLGVETFTPLLNPPQVAILGVGSIQLKAVRSQTGVEFVDSISLSLTADHQVIDGAPGARFLKVVREQIESVERLCSI